MADLSPDISSEHLARELGFRYHYKSVVTNSYWLTQELVQRVFDLGEDNGVDILLNAGSIMETATARMDEEEVGSPTPVCAAQRDDACHACLGSSVGNSAPRWADESHPPGNITINIQCSKALVRKIRRPLEPAPVVLGVVRPKSVKGKDRPHYDGVRVFDNDCYTEMGRQATRLAELFVEELEVREQATEATEAS